MDISYRPATEAIAATTAAIISFDDSKLPSGNLARLLLVNTGTNNGVSGTGVVGHKVKVNSVPLWDVTGAQLRALMEGLASRLGSAIPATTDLRYSIPFDLAELIAGAPCGIPKGNKVSYELEVNSSSSAGTSQIAWKLNRRDPVWMPRCIQTATGVAASTTAGVIDIKTGMNPVVGMVLPIVGATGITRLRIVRRNEDGTESQIFHGAQAQILESQKYFSALSLITTAFFLAFDAPITLPMGSFMEVDTGAGSAATDTYAPLQLIRV